MEKTCSNCHKVVEATGVTLDVMQLACPACGALTSYEDGPVGRVIKNFAAPLQAPALHIGQKGVFDGVEYTVTGVVVKQVQKTYYWREYILTAEKHEQLYLSETDGHWILLRRIDDKYEVQGYPEEYTYNGMLLKLYDYDDPKTFYAEGFFDYNVVPKWQRMIEYINPPYIYSVEEMDKEQAVYFGEHISSGAVRRAFKISSLPVRVGVGIIQPFAVDIRNMGIIFCAAAILILLSHLFIYHGRKSTEVLNQVLSFSDYSGKDFVSAPFTLEGGSAPMEITVGSNVDNSWAAVQVALVNEGTSEEIYAAKDIEYYHGYEDGENWSEGSTSETFNICGVSAGKYHLVITPQKPPEDVLNNNMHIHAEWNTTTAWNTVIPIIIMVIIFVIMFFVNANFNQRRWADSSYSPFSNSDY